MSDVHAGLTRALEGPGTLVFELDLDTTHRFIIFSDTHKGGRDRADEFERCEPACTAALRAIATWASRSSFSACIEGRPIGPLFMVHGHQGTFGSDQIRPLSRLFLRWIVRPLQRLGLPIGKDTPARDACLRGEHDREMYRWAAAQRKLILMAGHTHRPVWSSRTHLQILEAELLAGLLLQHRLLPVRRRRHHRPRAGGREVAAREMDGATRGA